ncbi:3-phosphoshikimate 1-carboxyvinyltransferase [Clostridium celatum]|uniref:3-phosphoshikimate 1-carboxyvinyltransferase n=1 Tax=Clostridium celatum TaxID=36834 RepID=UPI0029052520|nr:3-phosphoshikimate 1-carboxyvinyltransferase [Clostridium celatum]MDU2265970.1 3-phosphoshikimate 1-carboxyvinyltransferase [Clostridium celatum]MDU6296290.1 3-phosphoshikimate 1-carboxyvinyltransferase [Clostridium celatum]MDY3361464.1 3-phosphoshikimate 1-carboxyvinyltransferase [Clostridium celatum]
MADLKVYPSILEGEVKIPPSKSMAHRAIICAALSDGFCKIENIDYSDDIIATIDAMNSLGAKIVKYKDYIEVTGAYGNSADIEDIRVIDCNESGSTLRFLVPISLLFKGKNKFIGRGNLGKRPLTTYYNIFEKQDITYSYEEGKLNLIVSGELKPGIFEIEGNVSSQFITGILFTLPLLNDDSKIIITTEMESKGYIDLTLRAMSDFGIEVINNDYKEFIIKGNQRYKARNYRVEGDYSQAAFFLCADSLGNNVLCKDLDLNSLQGDKEVIDILERMNVIFNASAIGVKGTTSGQLVSTIIDGSQCPDIIPVLTAVAALTKGKTEIINAGRLRIKECDRLAAVTSELNKLGAKIVEQEDGLIVTGVEILKGNVEVWSHKDHRIAMTLAIASTKCEEPIVIKDYECIAKSYPNFFDDFVSLGGKIERLEEK